MPRGNSHSSVVFGEREGEPPAVTPSAWLSITVEYAGEPEAGLAPFTDDLVLVCESGAWPGGSPMSFAAMLASWLSDVYDGAHVKVTAGRRPGCAPTGATG